MWPRCHLGAYKCEYWDLNAIIICVVDVDSVSSSAGSVVEVHLIIKHCNISYKQSTRQNSLLVYHHLHKFFFKSCCSVMQSRKRVVLQSYCNSASLMLYTLLPSLPDIRNEWRMWVIFTHIRSSFSLIVMKAIVLRMSFLSLGNDLVPIQL